MDNQELPTGFTGGLCSSHGTFIFDIRDGNIVYLDLDCVGFGGIPVKVDVEEWKLRYPKEHHKLAEAHDCLDFGIWFADGKYEPPCEDWRKDREKMLADTCCEDAEDIEPAVLEKYLRSGGSACPWCDGVLEAEKCPDVITGKGMAEQKIHCCSCGREWYDQYKLVGVGTTPIE